MPTGKVKWFDADKGFGFLSQPDGDDVYVRADALPAGVDTLKAGTRVEFGAGTRWRDLVSGRIVAGEGADLGELLRDLPYAVLRRDL